MLRRSNQSGLPTRAFTLIELLVCVTIMAVLAGIVLASLRHVRAAARGVLCMNQLKTVGFNFGEFADERHHPYRGESEAYGPKSFRLEDFQESLYRIAEFWDRGTIDSAAYDADSQLLMCAAGPRQLIRVRGQACSEYAVGPAENVSIGFNMRLEFSSLPGSGRLRRNRLSSSILDHPWVPLAFDVDGQQATRNDVMPYYAAPPAGDAGLIGTGQFWFASNRHLGKTNAVFIGGHVLSSRDAQAEGTWQWRYQPPVN